MASSEIMMTLDNIDEVIAKLEEFRARIEAKLPELITKLCERGLEIAKEQCPVDTGDLRESIHIIAEGIAGQIIASSGHAAYVEFGTGIVGAGSPHPTLPWAYDVNGHGDKGWTYYKNDRFYWTAGQPAKPFMQTTARLLAEEAPDIAKEVFESE